MERKSGRKSTNTNAGKDRISSLPDVIIGHILSFLPTKYAVETSILSKRWRYVWTNITSLLFYNTPEYTRFHNFVDRVLHQCTSKNIQRFCLHTKHEVSYKVTTWINEAIRRNVYELELGLSKIPSCVFTCKTPTVLKLDVVNLSQNEIPTSFYLPSLRILFIIANHLSINLMEKFFRNCSALEDLNVRVHFVEDNSDFIISSPVLKRFKFESYSVCIESCKFVVNAPNLECMEMYDGNLQGRSVQSSSLVNEAKAGVPEVLRSFHGETIANRAVELLGGFSGVKSLSLSQYILRGLDHAYQDHLPVFYNMTRLELSKFEPGGRKILPRLLEVSPKLKVLILNKGCSDMSASSASYWTEPQILPEFLSSCLEDVEVKGFQFWDGYETKMVEYLLQHAAVLKNLTINGEAVLDPEIKVEFCQRLLRVTKELKKLSDSSLW